MCCEGPSARWPIKNHWIDMTPRRYRRQGHPKKVDIFHGETGHQAGETARGIIAHSSHLLSSFFRLSPTIIEPSSPAHLELVDCHSYLRHITPHKKKYSPTQCLVLCKGRRPSTTRSSRSILYVGGRSRSCGGVICREIGSGI